MFVYIENALGISIYSPAFQYNGKSLEELEKMTQTFLNIPNNSKVRIEVYNVRLGCTRRKRLISLNTAHEDVYIMLKGVE